MTSSNHPSFRARLRRMCQHRMLLNGKCLICQKQVKPTVESQGELQHRRPWNADEDEDPRDWSKIDPSDPLRR